MYIRYADLKIFKLKKYRVITELLASISNKKSVSKATTTYFWWSLDNFVKIKMYIYRWSKLRKGQFSLEMVPQWIKKLL